MSNEIEVISELNLNPPSKETLNWAKQNIREDPDKTCQLVDEFRDMIYSRGDCNPERSDDAFLLRFLRSRKFSLESAYKLFVNYHDFRDENMHYYKGVGFECLEKVGEDDIVKVPPYLDQYGRRILLFKLGNWNPELHTVDDVLSATLFILELAMLEPSSQIKGGIAIFDCSNIAMNHVLYMTPNAAHKMVQLSVSVHPMKLNEVHIINQSWIFETFFNIVKPLLHDKMKEKIYFHGNDMDSFHKYVDPKCLPDIYRGLQKYHDYKDWIKWFRNNKTVLKELRSIGYGV